MKHISKRGASLMVVLPMVMLLFLLGFFFIETVLLYSHQNEVHLQSAQLKYAGIAARELAMLEIVEAGFITSNTKKKQKDIDVQLFIDLPNQGGLFFGGNHGIDWLRFEKRSDQSLRIPSGVPSKQSYGTAIYTGIDLDGDGTVGSITNKTVLQTTCNVVGLPPGNGATFLLFESNCQLGIWNETLSFGVHYD